MNDNNITERELTEETIERAIKAYNRPVDANGTQAERLESRLRAALEAALSTPQARPDGGAVSGEHFVRGWINLDKLPGGMMMAGKEKYGPVPGMTACSITTSQRTMEDWRSRGDPICEVFTHPAPAPYDANSVAVARLVEAARRADMYVENEASPEFLQEFREALVPFTAVQQEGTSG